MLVLLALPSAAQEMSGVWLSPDWFFPGTRRYTESEVRGVARDVFDRLKKQNVTSVFLETFLRGYGICPTIEQPARNSEARVVAYHPEQPTHPVYPHLLWNYTVQFDTVLDPLQIFIEEGQAAGIEVHAWVHMFYWRMDNNDVMLGWHNGPSLWGRLMHRYLEAQAERLSFTQGVDARPGYESLVEKELNGELPLKALKEASSLFRNGCDTVQLEALLKGYGIESDGHPIGALISALIKAGGERPDFLLLASADDDPFPAPRGTHLRSIYVDPENPEVRRLLTQAITNIAEHHPGLAGIHFDHVRYPVDGQGLSSETGVQDGKYRYFSASDSSEMQQYRLLTSTLERRQQAVTSLVTEICQKLPRKLQTSAAVVPLYYRDRDQGKFRTSGYDYCAQAWLNWPVDFVVPMMYEYHPYIIRTLTDQYQELADQARPERPIQVYPGISRLRYTRDGSVKPKGWVFFDLSLARDVKSPRQENEDLDFGE